MNRQAALTKLENLADLLDGPLADAYAKAIAQLSRSADVSGAVDALGSGDVQAAVDALLAGEGQMVNTMRSAVARAFTYAARSYIQYTMPKAVRFEFTPGAPEAAKALADFDLTLFPPLTASMEAGLKAAIGDALTKGLNPRDAISEVRQFIGFTDYDYRIVDSFQASLASGHYGDALGRELRDKRYDGTLERLVIDGGELSDGQMEAMVNGYVNGLEDFRAETWSRTTALQTVREAQAASWEQAIEDFGMDAHTDITKTWVATDDDRTRPEHAEMDGVTIPFDDEFDVDDGVDVPGENAYNCRCTMLVNVVPLNEDRLGSFFADVGRSPVGGNSASEG